MASGENIATRAQELLHQYSSDGTQPVYTFELGSTSQADELTMEGEAQYDAMAPQQLHELDELTMQGVMGQLAELDMGPSPTVSSPATSSVGDGDGTPRATRRGKQLHQRAEASSRSLQQLAWQLKQESDRTHTFAPKITPYTFKTEAMKQHRQLAFHARLEQQQSNREATLGRLAAEQAAQEKAELRPSPAISKKSRKLADQHLKQEQDDARQAAANLALAAEVQETKQGAVAEEAARVANGSANVYSRLYHKARVAHSEQAATEQEETAAAALHAQNWAGGGSGDSGAVLGVGTTQGEDGGATDGMARVNVDVIPVEESLHADSQERQQRLLQLQAAAVLRAERASNTMHMSARSAQLAKRRHERGIEGLFERLLPAGHEGSGLRLEEIAEAMGGVGLLGANVEGTAVCKLAKYLTKRGELSMMGLSSLGVLKADATDNDEWSASANGGSSGGETPTQRQRRLERATARLCALWSMFRTRSAAGEDDGVFAEDGLVLSGVVDCSSFVAPLVEIKQSHSRRLLCAHLAGTHRQPTDSNALQASVRDLALEVGAEFVARWLKKASDEKAANIEPRAAAEAAAETAAAAAAAAASTGSVEAAAKAAAAKVAAAAAAKKLLPSDHQSHCTFAPTINQRSRAMDAAREALAAEENRTVRLGPASAGTTLGGGGVSSQQPKVRKGDRVTTMLARRADFEARMKSEKAKREKEQLSQCTFRPCINARPQPRKSRRQMSSAPSSQAPPPAPPSAPPLQEALPQSSAPSDMDGAAGNSDAPAPPVRMLSPSAERAEHDWGVVPPPDADADAYADVGADTVKPDLGDSVFDEEHRQLLRRRERRQQQHELQCQRAAVAKHLEAQGQSEDRREAVKTMGSVFNRLSSQGLARNAPPGPAGPRQRPAQKTSEELELERCKFKPQINKRKLKHTVTMSVVTPAEASEGRSGQTTVAIANSSARLATCHVERVRKAAADRAALQRAADAGFSAESYEKTMARRKAELDGEKHVKIPFSRLAQKEPRRRSAASTGQSASANAANQPGQRAQKETRLFMDVHLG